MRKIILVLTVLVSLVLANSLIIGKEQLLKEGTTVLLDLAPRDPRSLLQGDFMRLRYRLAEDIASHYRKEIGAEKSASGLVVIELDKNGVATFVRLHDDKITLTKNELLLYYRQRGGAVRLATDAYFFEEGTGKVYAPARYGELFVGRGGDAVLVGLRDAQFQRLRAQTPE